MVGFSRVLVDMRARRLQQTVVFVVAGRARGAVFRCSRTVALSAAARSCAVG
jgi:hypothetical protein